MVDDEVLQRIEDEKTKQCMHCKAVIAERDLFCPECGLCAGYEKLDHQ